jgi:hypothetical protein
MKFGIRLLFTSKNEATSAQAVAVAGYVNMGWGNVIDRSCKAEIKGGQKQAHRNRLR